MATTFIRAGIPAVACLVATILPGAFASALEFRAGAAEREPVGFTYRFDRNALATRRGAQRAYRHLLQAARRTCTVPGASSRDTRGADSRCVDDLVNQVVLRIGSEMLSGVHFRNPRAARSSQAASTSRSPASE